MRFFGLSNWSGRQDSNLRPDGPKPPALPAALRPVKPVRIIIKKFGQKVKYTVSAAFSGCKLRAGMVHYNIRLEQEGMYMGEKIKKIWKYLTSREMILYIVFGVLTTVLNLVIYFVMTEGMAQNESFSYFIAWVVAVAFAFVTNKKFVFSSKTKRAKAVLYELATFVGGRLLTFAIGEILITVFVSMLAQSNVLWKILTNIIEIVVNWLVSKMITFRKKSDS